MHFIDRLCLAWSSPEALAACMPSGMLHFSLFCFPQGIAVYCTAFVAQYWGAKRPQMMARIVWQGLYIGFITIPLILLSGFLAPYIFQWMGHEPQVARQETIYYWALSTCGGACVLFNAVSAFFNGQGKTWIVMVVDTFGAFLNAVLCVVLIFGTKNWGWWPFYDIPELGILGAGIATSSAIWVKTVIYFLIFFSKKNREEFGTWRNRHFDWQAMKRLFYFGAPNGLQFFVSNASFTVMLLLMGMIGKNETAATNLAFNVNALAFIPVLGLGMGLTALVGQQQGKKLPDCSARATRTALLFTVLYLGFFSMLYLTCPHRLLFIHEKGGTENFKIVADMTVYLMRFLAFYCIFDGLNVIFAGLLKGAGDTLFVLRSVGLLSPIPPLTALIGIRFFGRGLTFCWILLFLWAFTFSILFFLRYRGGKWRKMQVIEPEISPKKVPSTAAKASV